MKPVSRPGLRRPHCPVRQRLPQPVRAQRNRHPVADAPEGDVERGSDGLRAPVRPSVVWAPAAGLDLPRIVIGRLGNRDLEERSGRREPPSRRDPAAGTPTRARSDPLRRSSHQSEGVGRVDAPHVAVSRGDCHAYESGHQAAPRNWPLRNAGTWRQSIPPLPGPTGRVQSGCRTASAERRPGAGTPGTHSYGSRPRSRRRQGHSHSRSACSGLNPCPGACDMAWLRVAARASAPGAMDPALYRFVAAP